MDREILSEMTPGKEKKIKNITELIEMKSNRFSVYRERLKRKGVVDAGKYGELSFILPGFAEFVMMQTL